MVSDITFLAAPRSPFINLSHFFVNPLPRSQVKYLEMKNDVCANFKLQFLQ